MWKHLRERLHIGKVRVVHPQISESICADILRGVPEHTEIYSRWDFCGIPYALIESKISSSWNWNFLMPLSNIMEGGQVDWQLLYGTKRNDGQTPKQREIIQAISWESMFWSAAEQLLSKFNGLLAHYSWETKLHSNSSDSIGWVIPFLNFTGIGFGRRQIAFVGFKLCRNGIVRPATESTGVVRIVTPAREEKLMSSFGGAGASGDWGRGANIDPVHAEVIARTSITAVTMQQNYNTGLLDMFVADHKPPRHLHFKLCKACSSRIAHEANAESAFSITNMISDLRQVPLHQCVLVRVNSSRATYHPDSKTAFSNQGGM